MYRTLSLLLWLILFLMGCENHTPREHVIFVQAEKTALSDASPQYSYAGVVETRDKVSLSFRAGGKIIERLVEAGDTVHPGQLLARLDPTDLKNTLEDRKAQLTDVQTNVEFQKSEVARYKPIYEKGYVSARLYDQVVTQYKSAQAQLEKAKTAVEDAEQQLSYDKLYSDYDGVITKIDATAGQVVSAGQSVMRMALSKVKEIVINVPEQRVGEWKNMGSISVVLWAYPYKTYSARVREVAAEADPVTRTYTVKLSVPEADQTMQIGMTANVTARELTNNQQITVPLTAIQYSNDKRPMVWIIDKHMKVSPAIVKLGGYVGNRIIVSSGLNPGQWIVTAGVNSLRKGQKVKLLQ